MAKVPGYPRLLGDIGGTHARWAWQPNPGTPPQDISVLRCQAHASLLDSARHYLSSTGHHDPESAGIGVATAVTGDSVRMTNNPWYFSIEQLKHSLGVKRCLVINDFTALAMSLPALESCDRYAVGGGAAIQGAPIALIGPGTGLGVSGLLMSGAGHYCALSGEGGHATLAAADEHESALLTLLRRRHHHVSAERIVSGPGLVELYCGVCELEGRAALDLQPADVSAAAQAGTNQDCVASINCFSSFLGNVAGNLALTLGAHGGLYVGGGVVPALGAAFNAILFRQRFEDKGRFRDYLAAIPTWIITAPTPALLGVSRALDLMQAD
ncbi:MAG: glucokinase [Rhodoferax sp.]